MISISVSAITVASVSTTTASVVIIPSALGGWGSITWARAVGTRSGTVWAVMSGGSRRRSTTAPTAPFAFSSAASTLIFSVTPVSAVPVSSVIPVVMVTTAMMSIVSFPIISTIVRWSVAVAWAVSSSLSWLGRILDRRWRLRGTLAILGGTTRSIFVLLPINSPLVTLRGAAVPIVATLIATVVISTPATFGVSFVVVSTAPVPTAAVPAAAITVPGAAVSISVSVLVLAAAISAGVIPAR
mmetsp:Transcript_1170/g.3338  ORF Transcript_1170/g.3338 Transcript_1170/m.3338 type:complete len:242 (-) Transcript_1170:1714-2439(-)